MRGLANGPVISCLTFHRFQQDTTKDKKRNFKFSEHSNHKSGFAVVFTGWIINSQLFFLKLRSIGKEIRFMVIRLPVNSVRRILLLLF